MSKNSKELAIKYHGKGDKPTKKKNPNVANKDSFDDPLSRLGYSDGSPYRSLSYIDINTPSGRIDMSSTGIPLWANGRILPPYSGIHQFDSETVREIPLAQFGENFVTERSTTATRLSPPSVNNYTTLVKDPIHDDSMKVLIQLLDPTGISNYPDLYRALQTGEDIPLNVLGSLPIMGKTAKLLRLLKGARTNMPWPEIGIKTAAVSQDLKDYTKKQKGGSLPKAQTGINSLIQSQLNQANSSFQPISTRTNVPAAVAVKRDIDTGKVAANRKAAEEARAREIASGKGTEKMFGLFDIPVTYSGIERQNAETLGKKKVAAETVQGDVYGNLAELASLAIGTGALSIRPTNALSNTPKQLPGSSNVVKSILDNPIELEAIRNNINLSNNDIVKLEKYLDEVYDYTNLTPFQKKKLLDRETYYLNKNNVSLDQRIQNNKDLITEWENYKKDRVEYFDSPKFRERVNKQYGEMSDEIFKDFKEGLLQNLEKRPYIRPDVVSENAAAHYKPEPIHKLGVDDHKYGHTYYKDEYASNPIVVFHEGRHQLTNAEDELFFFPSRKEIEEGLVHPDLVKFDSYLTNPKTGADYFLSPHEFITRLDELKRDMSKVGYDYKTMDLTPEIIKQYRGLSPKEAIVKVTGKPYEVKMSELTPEQHEAVIQLLDQAPKKTTDAQRLLRWFKDDFLLNQINNKWGLVPPAAIIGSGGIEEKRNGGSKLPAHLPETYRKGGNIKWLDKYQTYGNVTAPRDATKVVYQPTKPITIQNEFPYYNNLTAEEKQMLSKAAATGQDDPIIRSIKSKATTGKIGQGAKDWNQITKGIYTGAAGALGTGALIGTGIAAYPAVAGFAKGAHAAMNAPLPFLAGIPGATYNNAFNAYWASEGIPMIYEGVKNNDWIDFTLGLVTSAPPINALRKVKSVLPTLKAATTGSSFKAASQPNTKPSAESESFATETERKIKYLNSRFSQGLEEKNEIAAGAPIVTAEEIAEYPPELLDQFKKYIMENNFTKELYKHNRIPIRSYQKNKQGGEAGWLSKYQEGGDSDEDFAPYKKPGIPSVESGEGIDEVSRPQETESFGEAFKNARSEGLKTFTWRGKLYGTKLKSEVEPKVSQQAPQTKAPVKAPAPIPPYQWASGHPTGYAGPGKAPAPKTPAPKVSVPTPKVQAPAPKPRAAVPPQRVAPPQRTIPAQAERPSSTESVYKRPTLAFNTPVSKPAVSVPSVQKPVAKKVLPSNQPYSTIVTDTHGITDRGYKHIEKPAGATSAKKTLPSKSEVKPPVAVKQGDQRQMPTKGIVVDRGSNQAYVRTNKGTYTYPVLTGSYSQGNVGLTGKKEDLWAYRSTPPGYYTLKDKVNRNGSKYYLDMTRPMYGEDPTGLWMDPISAFGVPAPKADWNAMHSTYDKEWRDPLYDQAPETRYASAGCVNCRPEDIAKTFTDVGVNDTVMVIDSRNAKDEALIKELKKEALDNSRKKIMAYISPKRSEYKKGGWLDNYK